MSLQVWLPFNNNINNQGVTGAVTQVTAPTYVNGKIGKAMSTGAVTIPAATAAKFYNNKAMSFCFWIYTLANSSIGTPIIGQSAMAAGDNRMFSIYQYPTSADLHLSWQNEDSSGTFLGVQWLGYMPNNTWTHIAITYDGSVAKVYQNGVYKNSTSGTSARKNFSYNVPIPNCAYRYLNDLRIYDEVLSEKQIKEISKGLVCHYSLDNTGAGCPNLLKNTNKGTSGWGWSSSGGSRTVTALSDGVGVRLESVTAGSSWSVLYYQDGNLKNTIVAGKSYAVSVDCRASYVTTLNCTILDGNGQNSMTNNVSANRATVAGQWVHLVWKLTANSSFTVSSQEIYITNASLTAGVYFEFRNIKMEEGTSDTPWCPHTSDASYAVFNINGTRESDLSGYGYHGTKSGTITPVSDTPRYSVAYNYTAGAGVFGHPAITLSQYTISFWGKHIATGKMLFGSNASTSSANNTWYWYGDNSFKYPTGEFYYEHNAGSADSMLNKWVHFVATYDGANVKVYRNAVYEGSKAATGTMTLDYVSVGVGYTSSSYWENGFVSDFRLYATALTADDVKELYQVSASIDTKGNILGYDFQEV